jgi:hypothetical protein
MSDLMAKELIKTCDSLASALEGYKEKPKGLVTPSPFEDKYKSYLESDRFKGYLGFYGVVGIDGCCGKPLAYGFPIIRKMEPDFFEYTRQCCAEMIYLGYNNWCAATVVIKPKEAELLYGKVSQITVGPRGGFKTVTYGNTKFISKQVNPIGVLENLPKPELD